MPKIFFAFSRKRPEVCQRDISIQDSFPSQSISMKKKQGNKEEGSARAARA
jgi:hypothetical protein